MHGEYGLTRSSVNLRSEPNLKSHIIEALNAQEHVEILGVADKMLHVESTRWHPPILGYTLKSSIVQYQDIPRIFPSVELGNGFTIPSVPKSLPLSAFLSWLESGAESPWLPADYLAAIEAGEKPSVGEMIRTVISDHRNDWDPWVTEVKAQGRETSATMDEWLVVLTGGREMWSLRAERLFTQPTIHAAAPAWVIPPDIVHWTGHVSLNDKEPKYKLWYEVEFSKLDREFKGWYRADLLQEYIFPTPQIDQTIPANKDKVFDLTHAPIRLPADPEIEAARKAKRQAAQYIDIAGATGKTKIHHNLCGQFCVAALAGMDVIPILKLWLAADNKRAKLILNNDYGTTIVDLKNMLDTVNKSSEFFRAEGGIAPITPGYIRNMLDTGRMAIIGTGIYSYTGVVKWSRHTRHWLVIEDIVPVGSSGWLRVYNSFANREEVYSFDDVFDTLSRSAIGLWVEPARPGL
jgi:hypothetical protein